MAAQKKISFQLLEQSELQTNDSFANKVLGGISAIDQIGATMVMVSDHDKKDNKSYAFIIIDGNAIVYAYPFYRLQDIEAIRYDKKRNWLYYSYEGNTSTGIGYVGLGSPDKTHTLFEIPISTPPSKYPTTYNRGIEGITFSSDNKLWAAFESGGDTSCGATTIPFYHMKFDKASGNYDFTSKTEYQYPFDRCSCSASKSFNGSIGNGVSEILALENEPDKILVLERCYDGKKANVLLYLATIVKKEAILKKELVFDFNDNSLFDTKDKNFKPDNLEGMTWGKDKDGSTLLYLVSDNNFNSKQKNQLIKLKLVDKH
jgi:hypothetical protein